MVESSLSPEAVKADLVSNYLRSKGANLIDDLDAAEPLLELQAHHELVVIVELCEAQRPSKLGSLGGSHENYERMFAQVEGWMSALSGDGSVRMEKWTPGMPQPLSANAPPNARAPPPLGSTGGGTPKPSRPQSASLHGRAPPSRPQSAMSQRMKAYLPPGMANPHEQRVGPRIGAFEVSYRLVNTKSGKMYPAAGPQLIYSKIATGKWPSSASRLVQRTQEQLQAFLNLDMGNHAVRTYVQAHVQQEVDEQKQQFMMQQQQQRPPPPTTPVLPERSGVMYASDLGATGAAGAEGGGGDAETSTAEGGGTVDGHDLAADLAAAQAVDTTLDD